LEGATALCLGVLKVVDPGEMAIGERSIRERPEMFGGLELRRIRRQEEQVDMLGDAQLEAGMPASAIQDEHDLLLRAGAALTRERGQFHFEERNTDRGGQGKDGTPRGGMDEAHKIAIAPIVAMLHRRGGPLGVEAPYLLEDRLQPDAVLVDGPEFDTRLRVGGRDRLDDRPQLFLQAACCSGSAKTWRGRGLSRLPSKRTR
jgi:hypothetical protein